VPDFLLQISPRLYRKQEKQESQAIPEGMA